LKGKTEGGHIGMKEGDCLSCHFPHFSNTELLLLQEGPALCLGCHSPDSEASRNSHRGSMRKIKECLGCHEPHVTEGSGLLKKIRHAPFREGNCEACHK
jgi:predicted CXXCH cytochrome family protein